MHESLALRIAKRAASRVPRRTGAVQSVQGRGAKSLARSRPRGAPGGRGRHLSGRYVAVPSRVLRRLVLGMSVEPVSGCWLPMGPFKRNGYKHCHWTDSTGTDRTLTAVHLVARMLHRDGKPLADDEVPHHRCKNPPCINPAHIKIVTHSEHRKIHGRYA